MALTLETEQKLERAGLVQVYRNDSEMWTSAARETLRFVRAQLPAGSQVRRDDVAKVLLPVIEVDAALRTHLDSHKLKQKYWPSHFTDLVIDRCWNAITAEGSDDKAAKNPD